MRLSQYGAKISLFKKGREKIARDARSLIFAQKISRPENCANTAFGWPYWRWFHIFDYIKYYYFVLLSTKIEVIMKITALSKNISQYESFNRLVIGQPGFEPVGLGPVEARKMHKTSSKWIIQLKSYENTKKRIKWIYRAGHNSTWIEKYAYWSISMSILPVFFGLPVLYSSSSWSTDWSCHYVFLFHDFFLFR